MIGAETKLKQLIPNPKSLTGNNNKSSLLDVQIVPAHETLHC